MGTENNVEKQAEDRFRDKKARIAEVKKWPKRFEKILKYLGTSVNGFCRTYRKHFRSEGRKFPDASNVSRYLRLLEIPSWESIGLIKDALDLEEAKFEPKKKASKK